MKRTLALFACAQALLLAACATPTSERAAVPPAPSGAGQAGAPPAPVSAPTPSVRTGMGVVESASVVSLSSSPSAAAGGTGGSIPTMAYRVKMDDGSTQNVVQAGERFALGERVQVTRDGRLARP